MIDFLLSPTFWLVVISVAIASIAFTLLREDEP